MSDSVNTKLSESIVTAVINSDNFVGLDSDLQGKIIDTMHQAKEKDAGLMGKLFGTKPINAAMHISLILCCFLLIIFIIDAIHAYIVGQEINMELFNTILPVITLSLGYIFGQKDGQ